MAGQRTLNPYVLVRLQCPQPELNEEIERISSFFIFGIRTETAFQVKKNFIAIV